MCSETFSVAEFLREIAEYDLLQQFLNFGQMSSPTLMVRGSPA